MATGIWNEAATLLREAAATIEQRANGRDVSGLPDTVAVAAVSEGLSEAVVLASLVGLKRARYARGADRDSAVDLLAYEARRLAQTVSRAVSNDPFVASAPFDPPEDIAGQARAAIQFDQAFAGNTLNTADTVGPDEA